MQIQIPAELVPFVEQEIACGRFPSQEEMLLAGLRLLKQDRDEAIAGIRQGLAEWRRGAGTPLDEVFSRLRAKHGVADDA